MVSWSIGFRRKFSVTLVCLLLSCGGDKQKFDGIEYINAKITKLHFIDNKLE